MDRGPKPSAASQAPGHGPAKGQTYGSGGTITGIKREAFDRRRIQWTQVSKT